MVVEEPAASVATRQVWLVGQVVVLPYKGQPRETGAAAVALMAEKILTLKGGLQNTEVEVERRRTALPVAVHCTEGLAVEAAG